MTKRQRAESIAALSLYADDDELESDEDELQEEEGKQDFAELPRSSDQGSGPESTKPTDVIEEDKLGELKSNKVTCRNH